MKLKINGKSVEVPEIEKLSTDTFIKLAKIKNFNLIDYLSIVLGTTYEQAETMRIPNIEFIKHVLFGNIPDYESIKAKKFIVVNGRRYNLDPDVTLGQRFIIEENGKGLKGFDSIIFILAVIADMKNYQDLLPQLYKAPASIILPEAFFLLKNLSNGKRLELKCLMKIIHLIKIRRLKKLLG